MSITKITENVYSVGVINPSLRIFDIIMEAKYGTSYNAYLITGEKNENAEVFRPSRSILKPRLFANIFEAGINLLTPGKRCPHLGCALKWNKYEKTWDCPCHGSRFSENGVILDNPSQKNLKTKLK